MAGLLEAHLLEYQQVAADPQFRSAPVQEQAAFLADYIPTFDAEFAKAPKEQQQQFIMEAVIPEMQAYQPQEFDSQAMAVDRPMVETGRSGMDVAGDMLYGAVANAAYPFARFGNAAALNYAQPFVDQLGESIRANDIRLGIDSAKTGIDDPISKIGNTVMDFAGMAVPFIAGDKGLSKLGAGAVRYSSPMAQAAGVALPFADKIQKINRMAQKFPIFAQAAKGALEFGMYDALKSNPENQFDMGARFQHGLGGAALGAALPVAGNYVGKALKGAVRQFAKPPAKARQPIEKTLRPKSWGEEVNYTYDVLRRAAQDIQTGLYKASDDDIVQLAANIRKIENDGTKLSREELKKLVTPVKRLALKAKAQASKKGLNPNNKKKLTKKDLQRQIKKMNPDGVNQPKAKVKQPKAKVKQPEVKVKQPEVKVDQPKVKAKTDKPVLKGSVKEQTEKVTKDAGFPKDAGIMTAKPLAEKLGRALTDAEKDIHQNLRSVATTEVVDAAKGVHRQKPINKQELKYPEVAASIPQDGVKTALKIDEAMQQGKAIKIEYVAENIGRSNEAVKVTGSGNAKVEQTEFTPLHWLKRGDNVMVGGHNQRGHFVAYNFNKSAKGSEILKAGKAIDTPFVGEYPNVYKGSVDFKVSDVLGRGARSEEGFIKTSEAIANAQAMADIMKPEFQKALPKPIQRVIKNVNKNGRFSEADIKIIQKALKEDIEGLKKFCNLLGME